MAIAAQPLATPIAVSTAYVISIIVFADRHRNVRCDIAGLTVTVLIRDAGGTTRSYTADIDDAVEGEAHVTLNAAHHVTVGSADAQVHVDGMMRDRFVLSFVEKLVAA